MKIEGIRAGLICTQWVILDPLLPVLLGFNRLFSFGLQSIAALSFLVLKSNILCRHVARSENLGGRVVLGGDNVPPLVEIGLTDLPKTGGGVRPPCLPPSNMPVPSFYVY